MNTMLILSALTVLFLLIAVFMAHKGWGVEVLAWSVITIFFGAWALGAAVLDVGYGHVPEVTESLSKRLKVGIYYQVIGSIKDGNENVVFVKPYQGDKKTPELFALRVKEGEIPPTYFTLVGDKPTEVIIPR